VSFARCGSAVVLDGDDGCARFASRLACAEQHEHNQAGDHEHAGDVGTVRSDGGRDDVRQPTQPGRDDQGRIRRCTRPSAALAAAGRPVRAPDLRAPAASAEAGSSPAPARASRLVRALTRRRAGRPGRLRRAAHPPLPVSQSAWPGRREDGRSRRRCAGRGHRCGCVRSSVGLFLGDVQVVEDAPAGSQASRGALAVAAFAPRGAGW
jgi:hypothetical protein